MVNLPAGNVRGDCTPGAVLARPDIGVAAGFGLAIGGFVDGPRMDDRDVAVAADLDVGRLEPGDRHWPRGLFQELRAIDQRAVRVRAVELGGEDFVEAPDVGFLD